MNRSVNALGGGKPAIADPPDPGITYQLVMGK
jgi:hypothetical protein